MRQPSRNCSCNSCQTEDEVVEVPPPANGDGAGLGLGQALTAERAARGTAPQDPIPTKE